MLSTIASPQRARYRYPARRLHLIDIENLAGAALPTLGQVRQTLGLYTSCLAFGAMDQVEVGSSHLALLNAALGWPNAHYRIQSGPDGADLALLDVLRHEHVAGRFTQVAIGSGDHLFAEEAASLAAQGVWVTVISRRRGLSPWLAEAAREVIFLDTIAEAA
jgi:hypothetical protein